MAKTAAEPSRRRVARTARRISRCGGGVPATLTLDTKSAHIPARDLNLSDHRMMTAIFTLQP